MRYVITNADDAILFYVSLCGAVENRRGFNPLEDMGIKYEYYKDRKNFLISKGFLNGRKKGVLKIGEKGRERLAGISPEIPLICEMNPLKRGEEYAERNILRGKVTGELLKSGADINFLNFTKKDNNFGKLKPEERLPEGREVFGGGEITARRLFEGLGEEACYITAGTVKSSDPLFAAGNESFRISSAAGIYCRKGVLYGVYAPSDIKRRISRTAESKFLERLSTYRQWAYGKEARYEASSREAVIITENIRLRDILSEGKGFILPRILLKCFIIDLKHMELPLRIITSKGYREKLKALIYGKEAKEKEDGTAGGIPSYEFLSCEFKKLEEIRKRPGPVHIICYPHQKEQIKECLLGKETEFFTVGDELCEKLRQRF